jgi:hypothetical protein
MIYMITDGDDEAPNKLVVATCTLGMMRVEPMVYLSRCGTPLGQKRMQMWVIGHTTQDARNIAATYAQGKGYEYLMFWDDDVIPLPSAVMPKGFGAAEVLLATMDQNPSIDILGGVYPARQVNPAPIVTVKALGEPWWGWEDGGIHKVWMTGTGFTIYRMSSLQKLTPEMVTVIVPETGAESHVLEYFVLDPMGPTDDYHLAKRAEAAGLTWYVHGGVTACQVNPDGQIFHFKDARQRIAEEVSA